MNSKILFANWQVGTRGDYGNLLVGCTCSEVFFSKPYGRFLRVITDDRSYLAQLEMEYELSPSTDSDIDTLVYLTKVRNSEDHLGSSCIDAFVNLDDREIVINGVNHYGYFKSVLLGSFGFFDEIDCPDNVSIHAALISLSDKGILFVAPSGRGKSTYSLGLNNEKGFTLVSDDWVIVDGKDLSGRRGDIAMRMPKERLEDFDFSAEEVKFLHHPSESKIEVLPCELSDFAFSDRYTINEIILLGEMDISDRQSVVEAIMSASYHIPFNFPCGVVLPTLPNDVIQIVQNRSIKFLHLIESAEIKSVDVFKGTIQQSLDNLRRLLKND